MSDKKTAPESFSDKIDNAAEKLERKLDNTVKKLESAIETVESKLQQIESGLEKTVETIGQKLDELETFLDGRRRERLERVYEGNEEPDDIIIELKGLKKFFPRPKTETGRRDVIRAVDGIDLRIVRGETLGIVGESGCGKSTAARCLIGLLEPTAGNILLYGKDVGEGGKQARKELIRRTGIVFQDPYGSLNPRMTVGEIVSEPLRAHKLAGGKTERLLSAMAIIESCGLQPDDLFKYPHQFSGGQRQRICIARALIAEPDLVVCDEAVSALDVSIQAQIINLLIELREARDLTYAFISHDLEVVRFIADRVAVMYLGRIVEVARKEDLFSNPKHPYTVMLLESAPVFGGTAVNVDLTEDTELTAEEMQVGCRFRNRCKKAKPECREIDPEFRQISKSHATACNSL